MTTSSPGVRMGTRRQNFGGAGDSACLARLRAPQSLRSRRGSALLTVLWISAALAAVSLSLSNTVRGETERVSTDLDGLRAYYLAAGAVERATIETLWGRWHPDARRIPNGPGWFDYTFPAGTARVEMIPETAKLDVNSIHPDRLARLLAAMEVEPGRAQAIAAGI